MLNGFKQVFGFKFTPEEIVVGIAGVEVVM
jgi:hypothetical protein